VSAPRLLILETSCRAGLVAVAEGECLLGERPLDEARRHARDLAPAVRDLLAARGWKAGDLDAVLVSRGPGSYTGLRVGLMSAKALAYATGCAMLALDTFAAVALQAPAEAPAIDVVADAQKDNVYLQKFQRGVPGEVPAPAGPLRIVPVADWLAALAEGSWVTGPGLARHETRLPPSARAVEAALREPRPASLLRLGLARWARGERDDPVAVEPLYLRPSSAEEQWAAMGK
jgi:tRNA threonylcarbamoyladenosine biosynthesis protein TsaB